MDDAEPDEYITIDTVKTITVVVLERGGGETSLK